MLLLGCSLFSLITGRGAEPTLSHVGVERSEVRVKKVKRKREKSEGSEEWNEGGREAYGWRKRKWMGLRFNVNAPGKKNTVVRGRGARMEWVKGTNTRTEKDGRVHGLKRAREEEEGDTGMEREKEKNHKRAEGRVAGQSAGAPTTRGVWRIRGSPANSLGGRRRTEARGQNCGSREARRIARAKRDRLWRKAC